mmetsp:Transcript_96809/g.312052  ORF Transcript_96809/g.312052 Transcript_96809/m.312052 type:complete len:87 (+) Transcript_96809:1844-2104(+)
MSRNVVLPQPLGPMIATSSPDSKWPEHGSRTVFDSPLGNLAVNARSLNVRQVDGKGSIDRMESTLSVESRCTDIAFWVRARTGADL